MKTIETHISSGYLELIKIFAQANELVLQFDDKHQHLKISFEEDSDTDIKITFLSYRHLGFENMLVDYLKRCGVTIDMIPLGKFVMRKTDAQLEKEWQEHRRKIGLIK